MAVVADKIYQKFKRAIASFGYVVRTSVTSVLTSDPTISAGSGAPSAAEPNGSLYFRTGGGVDTSLYQRIGGAWVAVSNAGAGGAQVDLIFSAATELTIASGAITATQAAHTVDTESDAGSDDLDTIAGGTAEEMIVLRAASATRTVVLKHAVGANRIACPGGRDISLAEATDFAALYYNGTQWVVVGYNTLALGGGGLGSALASVANGLGASLIGIEDAATDYTATTVEGALAEVKVIADAAAPSATLAGTGGAGLVGVLDSGGKTSQTTVEGWLSEIDPGASFYSTEQTGTGSAQNVAHGLGRTPRRVRVYPSAGHDGAGGAGGQFPTWSQGAHDGTNAVVTVSNGAKFYVEAI